MGFEGGSVVKNLPAAVGDAGDMGSIPGWGRSPGEGNGNPLQYYQKSESEVAQSCPTLCNRMVCNPPGSSVHGILQARILGWAAIWTCPQIILN